MQSMLPSFKKTLMSFKSYFFLSFVCVSLVSVGCESQRYKPADWGSMDNSTLTDRNAVAALTSEANGKKNLKRPDSPTNWMELSGTGGEAVTERRANGTMPYRNGGTSLPRRNGTSLPRRNGTSLPRRNGTSLPWRNGTSLPWRSGTSLPQRGYGSNTSLPNRQSRYSTGVSGTTIPQRGRYQPASTLPARNSDGTPPRR